MTSYPIVKATNATTFRNNLKKQLDLVINENISLIVTRNDDKNVVVLSESEYGNLMREINNLKYEKKILESALQVERGEVVRKDLSALMTHEE